MEEKISLLNDDFGDLKDLEPYSLDDESFGYKEEEYPSEPDEGQIRGDERRKKFPFVKIFEKYYVKAIKDKPQAMKISIFIQVNLDPFYKKGLIVLPAIKFSSAKFSNTTSNGTPTFDWKNEKVFWIYGWDLYDKFMEFIYTSLKTNEEMKEEIKNLNENIMKTLTLYKPKDGKAVVISINDVQGKDSVRCSFSLYEVKTLLDIRNIIMKIVSDVISRIILKNNGL